MKKIEAIIQPRLRDVVVDAIKKHGVGGVSIQSIYGQGSQDSPLVGQYYSRDMIICVVDDPKVDGILNSIAAAACTGTKGDGKVFVTNVDDALDICSKKRGTTSI